MSRAQRNETVPIEINRLELDVNNPRLPSLLNSASQDEILQWMLDHEGIVDLMRSIGEQGYFNGEPLLVVPSESRQFTVVEGNRRLAALMMLHNPDKNEKWRPRLSTIRSDAVHKPERVPCIVYSDRTEILDYLGYRHVTGIKSWGPLEKARYLKMLSESQKYCEVEEDLKYRRLAKVIGSRVDYVKRILAGLKLYDRIEDCSFYDIDDLDETSISFSLVTTALGHPGIVKFLGLSSSQDMVQENLDGSNLEDLTRWIFERKDGRTRLGESRHLRDLNKVVDSDIALDQFRDGRTLQEALIYTDAPAENFRNLLRTAKSQLQDSQEQLYLVRSGLQIGDKKLLEDITYLADDISTVLAKRMRRINEAESVMGD